MQREMSEEVLLEKLRSGDASAFAHLVDQLNGGLYALARTFTSSPALAEDIVQETWLAVIRGLRGFEGRSLLRTWIFGILVRRARTMAAREKKRHDLVQLEPSIAEWEPGGGRVGLWEGRPAPWPIQDPAALHQDREVMAVIVGALAAMPESQRQVVQLRDVEGLSAAEACNVLEISETNQRVLLHRGRARVRIALDRYFRDEPGARLQAPPRNGAAVRVPHLRAAPESSKGEKESTHGR
jgi:RNA polymerase sigma-70 factor, ECF subfamily